MELYLPAADTGVEVKVPRQLKVAQTVNMLIDFLKRQEMEFIPQQDCVLCDMETGRVFDSNLFIDQAGLHNGSRVMLI